MSQHVRPTYLNQDCYVNINFGYGLLGVALVLLDLLFVLRGNALYRLPIHANGLDEHACSGVARRVCQDDDGA